ncbi:MAG: hypothetical protein IKJ34_07420 [Mailhella sp.]|nr:hypothetical protein [Mailhella sp.]
MPVNMQNLQNLASITSLDQLKVGADNQLQQRSGIGTFFRKIGDAFLNLSQAGRASITQRNERIVQAMQRAVTAAALEVRAEDRPMAARLSSVFDRIKTAATNMNRETIDGLKGAIDGLQIRTHALKYGLHLNPAFDRLSVPAQKGLLYALDTISSKRIPDKQSVMEQVKQSFFTAHPAEYDIDEGMRIFGESQIEEFLKPDQQEKIEDGIHFSFLKDANRHSIVSFNGQDIMPAGLAPGGTLIREKFAAYATIIKEAIPEKHHRFLPFITMMASQAGIDAAPAFLPFLANVSTPSNLHLSDANIVPLKEGTEHPLTLELKGDHLIITSTFTNPFTTVNGPVDGELVLAFKGQVTMNIDLAAAPRTETVDGKQVFIPQFTIENGEVHFETP